MTPQRVLVTGASGFVGRAVCGKFVRLGWQVRAATRRPGREPPGCESVITSDLAEKFDWSRALRGVGTVVHLAARVHEIRGVADEGAYRAVNATATESLSQAAATAGVRRFVFMSTIKVNGERTKPDVPFQADDAPNPQDGYARSKWEAERALAAVARDTGLQIAIIRSPLVYGAGVGANFLRLIRLVASRLPLPLGAVNNRRSLIFAGNLAALVVACATSEAAVGRTLLASDGDDVSTPELIRRIGAALGIRAWLFPFPVELLRVAGAVVGRRDEVARMVDSLAVDERETRRALPWQPPFTMEQGLSETVRWYRSLHSQTS